MLRWQRTKGFARFTHRFEIFQLPIQPCSHCNKVPLKLGMRNLPPPAFLQTHLTGQIKEAPCRLALRRFYLGREARCRDGGEASASGLYQPPLHDHGLRESPQLR